MNCEHAWIWMNDYVDGLLSEEERGRLERHVAECPVCRAELEGLQSLVAQAGALPRSVAPKRDLWDGIAAQIDTLESASTEQLGQARVRWGLFRAAAAVLIVGFGVYAAWLLLPEGEMGAEEGRPGASEYAQAEMDCALARETLLEQVRARKAGMAPETAQTIESNLRIIEEAVMEIQEALEEDPDNPRLVHHLMATQTKELDLLGKMLRLADST